LLSDLTFSRALRRRWRRDYSPLDLITYCKYDKFICTKDPDRGITRSAWASSSGLFSPELAMRNEGSSDMSNLSFTRHGRTRAQQRGIRPAYIEAVLGYADRENRRGNGCASVWISKAELRRLGPRTPEGIPTDRLQGLTVLQTEDQTCLTVLRNRKAKAYRRDAGRRS
jgi:hypothetical protein